jgi:hypothetical protein
MKLFKNSKIKLKLSSATKDFNESVRGDICAEDNEVIIFLSFVVFTMEIIKTLQSALLAVRISATLIFAHFLI